MSAKMACNTAELIGLGRDMREEEITVLGGWAGDSYGVPDRFNPGCQAGLIHLAGSGEIGKDSTVLCAHQGGQPALSAYGALFC